ncbi:MAG: ParB N-terminal domain-containing protein [Bacteroides sp.]|nr:ParB N-terminal domain-containing protein [Bacteroides sp.]
MSLISRRPAEKIVSELGTTGQGPSSALQADDRSDSASAAREQIEYIDIDRIDDDPRNFYELSGLDELAANIELLGLQQPIRVRPGEEPGRYVIVSGHRRRAAMRQLVMDGHGELRDLPCIVERGQESAALQELRLIMANSDTRKLTSFELGKQAERVNDLLYQLRDEEGVEFPGRMRDHVAEACNVSKSKLARLKVIQENLAKPWRPTYEKGKLAEATAYALAQMSAERQQVIYDGLVKQGAMPGSAMEHMVRAYGDSLAQVDAVECKTYGNGPCLNREEMQKRVMGQNHWAYNYCRQCCDKCSELAKCKYACSMLADKVKQLKADAKAQKQQEQLVREEKERPQVEQIKQLWKRFGEARAAAEKSVEECFGAADRYFSEKDGPTYEKRERLEGNFSENTTLPYGYSCYLGEVQHYVKLADLLGVSLDYLLCRTDDPAGFVPQPEGQLVFNGWMPGGTLPRTPCDVVVDLDVGDGVIVREVCRFDGKALRFQDNGEAIDFLPVRWMMLPDVVSDSDTKTG